MALLDFLKSFFPGDGGDIPQVFDPGGLSELTAGETPVYATTPTPTAGGLSLRDLASGLYTPATKTTPAGGTLGTLGNIASAVLPVAQIGGAVMQGVTGAQAAKQLAEQTKIASGAERRQEQIAGQAQEAAQPIRAFSQEELLRAQRGEIPPAIQAQIDLWRQGARQAAMDYAARSGQGDSQQLQSWLAWIDQQAQAMAAAALESEMGLGLQAGQVGGGLLAAGAGVAGAAGAGAVGQQQSIEQLIAASNQVLSRLTSQAA